jgi:flagellin-like protein
MDIDSPRSDERAISPELGAVILVRVVVVLAVGFVAISTDFSDRLGQETVLDDGPHYYFDGRIAEVTVFDRNLTQRELGTVEEYISDEHNIPLDGPG